MRGTSRSKDKADWMIQLFGSKYGENRFDVYEVPDMMADTAFDESERSGWHFPRGGFSVVA